MGARRRQQCRNKSRVEVDASAEMKECTPMGSPDVINVIDVLDINVIDILCIADFSAVICTCKAAFSDMWASRRSSLPEISVTAGVAGPAAPAWYLLRTRTAGRGGASLIERAVLRDLTTRQFPWTRVQLASGRHLAACVPLRYVTPVLWRPLLALQRSRPHRCRKRLQ